jgi:hypothetical protein
MRRFRSLLTAVFLVSCLCSHVGAQAPSQTLLAPQIPGKSLPPNAAAPIAGAEIFPVVLEKEPEVESDLATADGLGIEPVEITGPASIRGITRHSQPFKWVLSTDGRLLGLPRLDRHVIHSDEDKDIIKHVVANRGGPVYSAGIAKLEGNTLLIDNRSGHYQPSSKSLNVAKSTFERIGFKVEKRERILQDAPVANHFNIVPGPADSLYFIDMSSGRTWHRDDHDVWKEINTPLTKPTRNEAPARGPTTEAQKPINPKAAPHAETVKQLEDP